MTHQEKVGYAIRDLKAKGVNPFTTAPPLFRALWAAGVEIPPPLFMNFGRLFVVMALSFGTLFGVFMWIAESWTVRLPLEWLVLGAVVAGLLFGLLMALYSRRKAMQLRLPSWSDYPEA